MKNQWSHSHLFQSEMLVIIFKRMKLAFIFNPFFIFTFFSQTRSAISIDSLSILNHGVFAQALKVYALRAKAMFVPQIDKVNFRSRFSSLNEPDFQPRVSSMQFNYPCLENCGFHLMYRIKKNTIKSFYKAKRNHSKANGIDFFSYPIQSNSLLHITIVDRFLVVISFIQFIQS